MSRPRRAGGLPSPSIVVIGVALILAAASIIWLALAYDHLSGQFRTSTSERGKLVDDVESLRQQVIENGKVPVVPPPSNQTDSPSPDALTDQQVKAIARDVVNGSGLTSRPVVEALIEAAVAKVEAKPGPPPSRDVVLATTQPIVTAYLKANPPPAGKPGPTSTVPGPEGVKGEKGDPGERGAAGADGVSVVSASFDKDSCSIVQTLSNGTTQTFGPLCGADGTDAVPFTFRFQMPDTGPLKGQTYRCTVTAPDTINDCEPESETPTATATP